MISRKNKITNSVTHRKKISNVSLFFLYLTRLSIFPINVDLEKNALSFFFLSKKMFLFTFITLGIVTIGTALPLIIIGLDKVMTYFDETNANSTATDNLSLFGTFLTFSVFGGYYVMFTKKLGSFFYHSPFLNCNNNEFRATAF